VLQISAVHRPKDSEIDAHGKGVGNYERRVDPCYISNFR
jgi:hypothetical protein